MAAGTQLRWELEWDCCSALVGVPMSSSWPTCLAAMPCQVNRSWTSAAACVVSPAAVAACRPFVQCFDIQPLCTLAAVACISSFSLLSCSSCHFACSLYVLRCSMFRGRLLDSGRPCSCLAFFTDCMLVQLVLAHVM